MISSLGLLLGGRRGPPAIQPFDPSTQAGCTGHWRADSGLTGTPDVTAWASLVGSLVLGPPATVKYPSRGTLSSGKDAVVFDASNQEYLGESAGGSAFTPASIISVTEYTTFTVCNVTSITTNSGTHYNNQSVLAADSGGFNAPNFRSAPEAGAANFDGNSDAAYVGITLGQDVLITTWHKAGTLYVQKNNGTPVSVASGDTFALTNPLYMGKSQATYFNGAVGLSVVHNVALSDADRGVQNLGHMAYFGIV